MIETIVMAVIAAIVYALAGYLKSAGEEFDAVKFGATAVIGAFVGVLMFLSGLPITESSVLTQMAAYAGITAVVENLLKWLIRREK